VETTAGTSHGEISGSFWEIATVTLKARINSAVLVTRQRQPKEKIMNTVNRIDIEALGGGEIGGFERDTETVGTIPAPCDVGDLVRDFTLPTLDGGEGSLANYRGKVVLLVFTATWCPYCGAEAPFLEQEIWQRYRDRGVQVIAIDVKEPPEVMRPFRDRYGWTFPAWLDQTGELVPRFAPEKEFLPPEVAIINAHFILDTEGRVRYREYLNMEGFDARARTVASELEKVLEQS
jgi:peroxiredoxin